MSYIITSLNLTNKEILWKTTQNKEEKDNLRNESIDLTTGSTNRNIKIDNIDTTIEENIKNTKNINLKNVKAELDNGNLDKEVDGKKLKDILKEYKESLMNEFINDYEYLKKFILELFEYNDQYFPIEENIKYNAEKFLKSYRNGITATLIDKPNRFKLNTFNNFIIQKAIKENKFSKDEKDLYYSHISDSIYDQAYSFYKESDKAVNLILKLRELNKNKEN